MLKYTANPFIAIALKRICNAPPPRSIVVSASARDAGGRFRSERERERERERVYMQLLRRLSFVLSFVPKWSTLKYCLNLGNRYPYGDNNLNFAPPPPLLDQKQGIICNIWTLFNHHLSYPNVAILKIGLYLGNRWVIKHVEWRLQPVLFLLSYQSWHWS